MNATANASATAVRIWLQAKCPDCGKFFCNVASPVLVQMPCKRCHALKVAVVK